MNQIVVNGIVLSRTNWGEADRIITVLTDEQGKIRLLAKGVRKIKSKLAGGIELFSQNSLTYIQGRGDLGTLISSRMNVEYGNIIKNVERTMYAYEIIKKINKITEDNADNEYFLLLNEILKSLNELEVELDVIKLWTNIQILNLGGYQPNLQTSITGEKLSEGKNYMFSFDDMSFISHERGDFTDNHIKVLRLASRVDSPISLIRINNLASYLPPILQLTATILNLQSN